MVDVFGSKIELSISEPSFEMSRRAPIFGDDAGTSDTSPPVRETCMVGVPENLFSWKMTLWPSVNRRWSMQHPSYHTFLYPVCVSAREPIMRGKGCGLINQYATAAAAITAAGIAIIRRLRRTTKRSFRVM